MSPVLVTWPGGNQGWDAWALSGAEVGTLFALVVMVSGPLWARKAWGVWWTWDPRLTSMFLTAMMFAAYLALRSFGSAGAAEKRFAAGLGAMGLLMIPIVHYATKRWGGQHPQVISEGGGGIDSDMWTALGVGFAAFTMLVLWLALDSGTDRANPAAGRNGSLGLHGPGPWRRRVMMRTWMFRAGAFVVASLPALATAQEGNPQNSFQSVTGPASEDVSGMTLMVAAYALLWVLLLAYVVRLGFLHASTARNLERVEKTLADGLARNVAQSDARTESDH